MAIRGRMFEPRRSNLSTAHPFRIVGAKGGTRGAD
jgi:hypothetical protein